MADGFHGPGRESEALVFAGAIPSLQLVGFGGKTDHSVSISWAVSRESGGLVSLRELDRSQRIKLRPDWAPTLKMRAC
jgi:hypothetical protein